MAGSGQQETFLPAVRDCQWHRVRQLVQQGSSLEQRDVAVSQAVSHSQWGLVAQLVQLGISQQCRDLAVHKAARYCLWDTVDELVAAGVSNEKRDFLLQRGLRHRQWALVSLLLSLGVGQEPRGLVVTAALEHGQWGLVLDALRLGVSQELRGVVVTTALEHGQWELVLDTIRLGVSQDLRDLVLTKALEHGQWGLVLEALRLGVKQEQVTKVFQEVVSQKRWEYVPSLVKLCSNNDHTDFVLREAIRSCQWECVRELIKTGLTPAQQGLVCREALEWAHFDCAVELLRQGCEPDCAERIVLEAFRLNRCQDLILLLTEHDIGPRMREVILGTAKSYERWDEYLMILKGIGAKEQEMVYLVTTALHTINVLVILRLLSLFGFARRVFKQVLLTTQFSEHDIIILQTVLVDDHPDLVFYMFISQELWNCVLSMFQDSRVSVIQRRFALRHAIRKRAWKVVRKMAKSRAMCRRGRRYAFLQAARLGKWRLALKVSTFFKVSERDKLFALRMWLQYGFWDCLTGVYNEWCEFDRYWSSWQWQDTISLLHVVVEESIIADKIELFKDAISRMDVDDINSGLVIQTAMKYLNCNFIFELCRTNNDPDDVKTALTFAAKHRKWNAIADFLKAPHDYLDVSCESLDGEFYSDVLLLCLRAILPEKNVWPLVIPALDAFCGILDKYDALGWEHEESDADTTMNIERLTEWCMSASYKNICLVLFTIHASEDRFMEVVDQVGSSVESEVISFCFVLAVAKGAWESAASCLQFMPVEDARIIVRDLQDGAEYSNLIGKCRQRGQQTWAIYIAVFTEDWDNVTTDIECCQEVGVVDYVVTHASVHGQWNIVQNQLHKCSPDTNIQCKILRLAVQAGQSEICTALISKVDIVQEGVSIQSLLYKAVSSSGDREEMVKLCIEFGFSTHIKTCTCTSAHGCSVCWDCPMKTALSNGQMPLVKLLHKAGACSNRQLFRCKENADLRNRLQGQGRHDIVEYLDHAAATPRALQDLCRLQVSHLIGCRPGRVERVMSLDMPWPAKDLINFEDVLF
ncbi:uncharacterized protein [Littorina saxatilis]|uniref:uncharacterized protein n=1 Tax=Littorina saxatilis TaxID=31220 RepID=UPI0038B43691